MMCDDFHFWGKTPELSDLLSIKHKGDAKDKLHFLYKNTKQSYDVKDMIL